VRFALGAVVLFGGLGLITIGLLFLFFPGPDGRTLPAQGSALMALGAPFAYVGVRLFVMRTNEPLFRWPERASSR
jgi:hypothetical protein